jgi:coproporphyrinogen III oxidase-like Fe-S oxidoreductase
LLRLRTNEGVDLELLEKQFGAEKKEWVLEKIEAIDAENYTFNNNIIRLTNRGKLWADDIAMTLFAE